MDRLLGIHMVAGIIGVILTGVFASLVVNATGVSGGWLQLSRQIVLAAAGICYPFVMTLIILWITDKTVGLRVGAGERVIGLDLGEHGESAYELPESADPPPPSHGPTAQRPDGPDPSPGSHPDVTTSSIRATTTLRRLSTVINSLALTSPGDNGDRKMRCPLATRESRHHRYLPGPASGPTRRWQPSTLELEPQSALPRSDLP